MVSCVIVGRYKATQFTTFAFTSLQHRCPCTRHGIHSLFMGEECVTSPKNVCIRGYGFTRQAYKNLCALKLRQQVKDAKRLAELCYFTNSLLLSKQAIKTFNYKVIVKIPCFWALCCYLEFVPHHKNH